MKPVLQSVRLRLTIWCASALTVIVLLFAGGTYVLVGWSLSNQTDQQLRDALNSVEKAYRQGGDELEEIDEHGSVALFTVTEDGKMLYQSSAWRRNQLASALQGSSEVEHRSWTAPTGEPFVVRALTLNETSMAVQLATAVSDRLPQQSLKTLAVTMSIGIPISILIAAAGGYWLAGRALAPVNALATKAREITAERLGERLPVANPGDEFGRLASVFNEVLARLQDSFARLKRFTSDASHELRTPLTAMRSVGEVALQDNRSAGDYRDVIGSMLEEAERLTRLLDSLLTLTRADNDLAAVRREPLDAAGMVREVGDLLHSLSEERGQSLMTDAQSPLQVNADPHLLRNAIINLVDNAVKYTPTGGTIKISAKLSPSNDVIIEVSDTGPGIAVEHQAKVFERFYRVDKARSRETGGVGLGLALAKWAVEINGGHIELASEPGRGSTFRVVLPRTIT